MAVSRKLTFGNDTGNTQSNILPDKESCIPCTGCFRFSPTESSVGFTICDRSIRQDNLYDEEDFLNAHLTLWVTSTLGDS